MPLDAGAGSGVQFMTLSALGVSVVICPFHGPVPSCSICGPAAFIGEKVMSATFEVFKR
jgi:hypothetical protein